MLKDTSSFLGIKIGEIGTKLGMNATNNGFLGFENVRIPREHMLMKNSQVIEREEGGEQNINGYLTRNLMEKFKDLIISIFRY